MGTENYFKYLYDVDQFSIYTEKEKESEFDCKLKSWWEEKMMNGYFRYSLTDLETRYVPGKYGFVAQLNIKRALERRKPQSVTNIIMPFEPEKFHFGKVDQREILFQLFPKHWEQENFMQDSSISSNHLLIINVSPLEYCNSLLVPSVEKFHPQVLSLEGLRLAIETCLLSHDPSLKIGMNSLGGFASVNHLHFHVYYLKETLYLQYAPMKHVIADCYEIVDFPSEGFAFQLLVKENVLSVARSIMKLIEFLQQERIAHNIFITRGAIFADTVKEERNIFNAIRIFVWARKSSFGSKVDTGFNPALCELAGHLPIKERTYFNEVIEDEIVYTLQDICHDTYQKIQEDVIKIYS